MYARAIFRTTLTAPKFFLSRNFSKLAGTVKFFDPVKGCGFITPVDGTEDIFVHKSQIQASGFRSLAHGEAVEFAIGVNQKRGGKKFAANVSGPNGVNVQGTARPSDMGFPVSTKGGKLAETNLFDLGELFDSFNNQVRQGRPAMTPVARQKEIGLVLRMSLDNWLDARKMNKLQALYAPQSQGSGKTYLVQFLREFMHKDMQRNDSVVKKLMENTQYSHLKDHIMALSTTRSIVVQLDRLSVECVSFEEAVTLEVVAQITGMTAGDVLTEVRVRKLTFSKLCQELLAKNRALIVVLDSVMDLMSSEKPAHLAWLRSVALRIDTPEQKTIALMTLLKDLLASTLGKPGAVLYLTGRAPKLTYQLLSGTAFRGSPLMAQAVLFDAMQHEHIVEILMDTCVGQSTLSLQEVIGCKNPKEVDDLAVWALIHTGGRPRVLAAVFDELKECQYLSAKRTEGKDVWDTLCSVEVSRKIYRAVKRTLPQDIEPNWSLLVGGWDAELTRAALVMVLEATRDGNAVNCSFQVEVAKGMQVTVLDLLSVLGVPFKRSDHYCTMTVQLSVWTIRSLLESKTVVWSKEEIMQVINWMTTGVEKVEKYCGDEFDMILVEK